MRHVRWTTGAAALALFALGAPEALTAQDNRSEVEIWAQTCGNCHRNQPANRYTPEQWRPIIMHMRIDARLTDAEADAVLEFLTRNGQQEEQQDGQAASAERYIEKPGGIHVRRSGKPAG